MNVIRFVATGVLALLVACASTAPPNTASSTPLRAAAPGAAGMSAERLERLRAAFQAEVDAGRVPGAVIAVARRGQLVYHEAIGFQDKAAGKPMAKDSIFRLYSMTKPLTSVAAMQLVEEGRLQLTDPVSKYLPAFTTMQVSVPRKDAEGKVVGYDLVPATRAMTVHDLLRHTSGLTYGQFTPHPAVKEAYDKAGLSGEIRDMSPAQFTDTLAKQPLVAQPSAIWQYSLATDLLGRVVEAVTGKRLAAVLDERVFRPLGMTDTAFHTPLEKLARLAQPAADNPQIDVTRVPGNDAGGVGAVSTALDYVRFLQAMINGGSLEGQRILARPTTALMMSDHQGDRPGVPVSPGVQLFGSEGYSFGLGFMVRTGAGMAAVPGGAGEAMWAGYGGTFFWIDPKEQIVAVFMAQTSAASRASYRRLVKALVYQAVDD